MRTNNSFVLGILTFALLLSASVQASTIEYIDFSAWDHNLIIGGGQTFSDVAGDVDLVVTSVGDFDGPSSGNVNGFSSFHTEPGSHSFRFTFSAPLDLVVDTRTVDSNEVHSIFSTAVESYTNTSGAPAVVSAVGTGISITGSGFGINPTGAAFGTTTLDAPVTRLTLGYRALSTPPNKFGQWRVGVVTPAVPEPAAVSLFGIGVLGMLLRLRRRS
jgi:hypothetical protein